MATSSIYSGGAGVSPESLPKSPQPVFWNWASTPPMGWNSWDCFATTVTEKQTRAQAEVMDKKLKPFGWQYIVVDIQWYEPNAIDYNYRKDAKLILDDWGRLLPAPNRFPSGFKTLAQDIHNQGLKFGVHLMRGIPRQAVSENLPVLGTAYHASDIANTSSTCAWNGDMYGVDMTKPGAQEYYNSVFKLFAEWGVDFVKVDDIAREYHKSEIEAIRKAIDLTGRPMVLSLSPGETPIGVGNEISQLANMWRISDDFWDSWPALLDQFERCRKWSPYVGSGHFPDADMLPLGRVRFGKPTGFTHDEQITLMTLWSIFRSPLMFGGDLTQLDDFTLSLITNREVLSVNQNSHGGHQLFNHNGFISWVAEIPDSKDRYLALFNTLDPQGQEPGVPVLVDWKELGLSGSYQVRDLWHQKDMGRIQDHFKPIISWHGAGLYRIYIP